MPTEHHDGKQGVTASVEPATLINVKIVEIEKTVEVPKFKSVSVDKPVFVDKEYERPVPVDKEYERPVPVDKEYERPIVKNKEVVVEVPVPLEKPYDMPVPKEVPYELPVVTMKEVSSAALEATSILKDAKAMLKEVEGFVKILGDTVADIKNKLPEEIKMPKLKHEEIVVKDVRVVEETIHVIGKVITKER